jgi:thioredoxin-dependent peroxiredoxin
MKSKPSLFLILVLALLLTTTLSLASLFNPNATTQANPTANSNASNINTPLAEGKAAPAFQVKATNGKTYTQADLKGKPTILVFYPMNFTPGCTLQLCTLRDNNTLLEKKNIQVLAINPASLPDHQTFAKAHKYPFPLLSDTTHSMTKAYQAEGAFGVPQRTVYVTDAQGIIRFAKRGTPTLKTLLKAATGE